MFYLSDLIGKKVIDEHGNTVARIRDVVAVLPDVVPQTEEWEEDTSDSSQPENGLEQHGPDVPRIKGLVARLARNNSSFYLPIKQVASLGVGGARLSSSMVNLQPFERRDNEMLLVHDLWDKQVIDLKYRRVVRVNDIVISESGDDVGDDDFRWWVRGVDSGLGGIARRLHIVKVLPAKSVQPNIIVWRNLDLFGSNVPGGMLLQHKKLAHLHPVEIARITDAVSYHQGAEIIASLDDTLAADTLEELVAERQTDIVENMPEDRAADILEEMSPDEATDLIAELSEEKADSLLEQMDEAEAQEVRQLMRYPEHSAGGLMTTEFVCVQPMMTVDEVITANKDIFSSADLIYYMYVIDSEEAEKLLGVITVRDLLVNERDTRVGDFMLKDILTVRPGENKREVARKMAEYNLLALPVVDGRGVLLGVVTVDDALDVLLPEGWKKRLPRIFS